MNTQRLDGDELSIAAARAMGWRFEMGAWYRGDGTFAGNYLSGGVIPGCLNEREMLAWLHGRGGVEILTRKGYAAASQIDTDYHEGADLRESLARLVVAVAAREAKA